MKPWLGNRLRELPIRAYVTVSATDKYTLQDADSSVDHTAEGSTVTTVNFGLGIEFKSCQGYVTYINQAGEEVVNRGILDWVNTADDYYYIWFSGLTSWEFPTVYIHGDIKYLQTYEGIYDTVNVSGTSIYNLQTSALIAGNEKWVYNVIATNCSQLTDGGKFYVRDTHIKSVDISGSALDYVSLYSGTNNVTASSLESLTANDCPNLEQIYLTYCKGNISASNNQKLTTLWARNSALGSLTFNNNNIFETLYFDYAAQPSGAIDISGSTADFSIYADYSTLTNLDDFVKNEMQYFGYFEMIYNATIKGTLDLSDATALHHLYLGRGKGLDALYLTNAQKLSNLDIARCYALKDLRLPIPQSDTALKYVSAYDNTNLTQISTDGGQTYSTELALSYPNLQSINISGWTQNIGFVGIGSDAVGSTREPAYENNALTSVNVNSAGIKNCAVRVAEGNTTFTTLTVNNALERLSVRGTSAYLPKTYPTNLYGLSFTYCHFHVQGITLSSLANLNSVDIGHTEFAGVAVPDIDLPARTANDGSLYMSTDSDWFEDVADKATALGWAVYNSDTGVKVRDAAYVAPSTDATVTE